MGGRGGYALEAAGPGMRNNGRGQAEKRYEIEPTCVGGSELFAGGYGGHS